MTARDDARAALAAAMQAGLKLSAEEAGLRVKPAERLTAELRDLLKRHKPELLALLRADPALGTVEAAIGAPEHEPRARPPHGAPPREAAPASAPASHPDLDRAPAPPWPRGPQHCMTCWGTRFLDLRDGRRWACFTCAAPEAGDVVAECANGPERPERSRAGARVAGERAASARAADEATQSQTSCGGEVTADPKRPNGAGVTGDGNSNR